MAEVSGRGEARVFLAGQIFTRIGIPMALTTSDVLGSNFLSRRWKSKDVYPYYFFLKERGKTAELATIMTR